MSLPNRRRGRVSPPPAKYDPEWENQLRRAFEESILKPDDFTNSYPFNSPWLSGGRIEVTQISNVTGGPSNVTGEYTKTSPHDEESETDGSHHWVMRQWRPPSYCGTAYYASPARLPEAVTVSPNVSGFRLDYDNLGAWSSYDAIADALASTDTKICFQAPVTYSVQTGLFGAVSRVDDEMLTETKSYWQMSLADLRDGVASHALSIANYQSVSNNASGSLLPDQGILDVTSPLEAVDNPGAFCTTIRLNASAADKYLYSTAADTWAEGAITAFGRSLLDDADAATGRNTLGASTGVWGLAVGGTAADLSATGGTGQFLRQSSAGAAVTVSAIGHADLGSGGGGSSKYLREDMSWQTVSAGVTDHGALTGLSDDDHSIYALLLGRSGGQTLYGGTASGDGLLLKGTADAGNKATLTMNNASGAALAYDTHKYTAGNGTLYGIVGGSTITQITSSGLDTVGFYAHITSQGFVRAISGEAAQIGYNTNVLYVGGSAIYGNIAGTYKSTLNSTGLSIGMGSTGPARALEVRSTSAQQRWSYDATFEWELAVASDGANKWATNSTSVGSTELESTRTITGAVTDGYAGSLILDPGYTAATAQTVTRHNYLDAQDVSVAGAGPAAVTDACLVRFDAAAGTHKATVGATTKTTPGGVDAWIKININGTIYYVPAYLSTTA